MITQCKLLLILLAAQSVAIDNVPGRNLIVVTLPDIANEYYKPFYDQIVDFLVSYEQSVENDNFIILADKEGIKNIRNRVSKGRFLYGPILDIWMRDMTSTGRKPGGLALFGYEPSYIEEITRKPIRDSFLKAMAFHGIAKPYDNKVDAVVDGGNIVDNGVDWAIATERIYLDNKVTNSTEGQRTIREMIKSAMKYNNFLVVKEFPGDTLGHSDGMVSFIDDKSLVISSLGLSQVELDDPKCWGDKECEQVKDMISEIKGAVESKGVNVVVIPNNYNPVKWRNFNNACGAHVNSLVADKFVYMPVFYDASLTTTETMHTKEFDDSIYDIFNKNTNKTIVKITVPEVICRMGGNVRCLAWQPKGDIADRLVEAAAAAADSYYNDTTLDLLEEEFYNWKPNGAGRSLVTEKYLLMLAIAMTIVIKIM